MAMFPFTGWDDSFYGDLHIQGKEGVQFYTQQKVISTRWFGEGVGDVWKKVAHAERCLFSIKGGEIVTADERYVADIFCEGETITRIDRNLRRLAMRT